MRYLVLTGFIWALVNSTNGQTVLDSMVFDNTTRFYSLYIPANSLDKSNLPLVFNLHGRGSTGPEQQIYAAMDVVADTANFIICYPDGIDELWNSGFDPNGVDDAGFINALINEIHNNYSINLDKVYSCGMSNGGYQSLYMACEITNRFAAVASVTGSMTKSVFDSCQPSKAIPVMQIHGTGDDTVLYEGSDFGMPIEEVVQFWVMHNQCNAAGDTLQIENIDTTDQSTAERISYSGGINNSEVIFYKIANGGHTWPGSSKAINQLFELGIANQDFNASAVIWNFFNQYSLSDTLALNNETLSINELAANIYPNPFDEFVYVSGSNKYNEIQIFNLTGQVLYQSEIPKGAETTKVGLNQLNPGTYLLEMISEDYTHWHKIIKQ